MNISLKNKTVLITGASRGIGKAIAEAFHNAGANLILISRNEEKLKALSQELLASYFICDVSNESQVKEILSKTDKIDILINNAGVYFTSSVEEMESKKWQELLDTNLNGCMYFTREALPKMIKNNFGRIINISSISGKVGDPFGSAYSASKFGMIGFTQSLAQEVARKNITANCICPGWVKTDMAENILSDPKFAENCSIPLEHLKEYSLEAVPIGRYIFPNEVANLALYLASEYASGITGQSINIDGGVCMH